MKTLIEFIKAVLFLPILLLRDIIRSNNSMMKKIVLIILAVIFIGFTWIGGYKNLYKATDIFLYDTGLSDKLNNITVRGKSMLPTIQNGEKISMHNPNKFKIERGDIVSFINLETGGKNYLKRVIGLPGDHFLLKNGQVYINNLALKEEYVNNSAPTYGNTALADCQSYTVPKDRFVVMGDNRIASTDSRVIGFVDKKDLNGIMKKYHQTLFLPTDKDTLTTILSIDPQKFVDLINVSRSKKNLSPLQLDGTLNSIAAERSKLYSPSQNTMQQSQLTTALDKEKYDYLLAQEVLTMGNYNEEQLTEHILELQPYNLDFLSQNYYEIGIGTTKVQNNECEIHVTNIILAMPTKPNTSQKVIDSIQKTIDQLNTIISNLKKLKSVPEIDTIETQNIIDELTDLLQYSSRYKTIALENRWLTDSEIRADEQYLKKSDDLKMKFAEYLKKNAQYITDPVIQKDLENYKWGNQAFNDESYKAQDLFAQGKYEELIASSDKMLKLAKNNDEKAIAHYWKGLGLFNLGNYSEAETNLLVATQLNTLYAAPYATLAAVQFQYQDYNKGLEYAKKCEALDTQYGWCHNNLAIAYYSLGQKEKALQEMQIAVSLDPTSYTFNDNLKRMKAE